MARGGWVYIMADRYRGTLYIGVTGNLAARVWAHKEGRGSKFCARYSLAKLVYAEQAPTIEEAIAREKAMKKWNRAWKIELIERANPEWIDLYEPSAPEEQRDSRFRGNDQFVLSYRAAIVIQAAG